MAKDKSDTLFVLIKSLKKSEKRYFKLAESQSESKKYVRLFNPIDKQTIYNEDDILKMDSTLKASLMSNLKAHLYNKILQSLRMYNVSSLPNIQLHEMIDHAQLLFNKGLYMQCEQILKKAKKLAKNADNLELQLEILKWEKQIISHTIGKDIQGKVDEIVRSAKEVSSRINNINTFTNLQVKFDAVYKKTGFIRDINDFKKIQNAFVTNLPIIDEAHLSISEKISLYELYIGYYSFIQDFEKSEYYATHWVALFEGDKTLRSSRTGAYLSGLNHLLIAQSKLLKYTEFQKTKKEMRLVGKLSTVAVNENLKLRLLKYSYVHEFNWLFMVGDFKMGVRLMERLKDNLEQFIDQLDLHSRIIMFYKTACLYFGADDFKNAVVWLNKIINLSDVDLREDIHGFARILNLISHYELGNIELIQYNVRSTYRFLSKKSDLHQFQRYILNFLKKLEVTMTDEALVLHFDKLKQRLIPLAKNKYERRAFIYFDIISWLESKIEHRPVREVIKGKVQILQ